jgi:hypothetical protein
MNKQDAMKRINAIEDEARALRAIIESPEVPVRWKPNDVEQYFMVSTGGCTLSYKNVVLSAAEYAYGNCFKTEAHAEIAAKAVSRTLKVCAAALAVDPDAGKWVEAVRIYSVYQPNATYDGRPMKLQRWTCNTYTATCDRPIYVHTKEQAVQMAAMLNAEGV